MGKDNKSRGSLESFKRVGRNNDIITADIAKSISGLPGDVIRTNTNTIDRFNGAIKDFPVRIYKDNSVDLSKLLSKKDNSHNDTANILTDMLDSDENIINSSSMYKDTLLKNKVYDDIDMICKYMPQLDDCLCDFRSNILSPDEMIKSTINIRPLRLSTGNGDIENEHILTIKKKYKIDKNMNKVLYNTLKYGKQPVYCKNYDEIMAAILNAKNNNNNINEVTLLKPDDNYITDADITTITESMILKDTKKDTKIDDTYYSNAKKKLSENMVTFTNEKFNISEGIIDSIASDMIKLASADVIDLTETVTTICESGASDTEKNKAKEDFIKTMNSFNKKNDKDDTKYYKDGMLTSKDQYNKGDIKVKGSLLKIINNRDLSEVTINDVILGYMHFEESIEKSRAMSDLANGPTKGFSLRDINNSRATEESDDVVLKNISRLIVKRLDKKFIESNPEFTDVIYEFCKYNGILNNGKKYNIRFIKAEDIVNFEVDGGISKLDKSLFPAKLYCVLLLCNMMAKVSRGNDKRAFYIKQGIDTNVAQTVMDTILQIKKSEFGAGDITNMNKMFSLVGRFNDIFIPTSPNGDRPFEVDVVAGQDTQIKDEFLEYLERIAVNVTGTPSATVEFTNDVEYARSLSMANAKYARSVLTNQTELYEPTSDLMTKLYKSEYDNDIELEAVYPAPKTLINQTISEQYRAAQEMVQSIVETTLGSNPDPKVQEMLTIKLMIKFGPTGIDYAEINKMKRDIEVEIAKHKDGDEDDSGNNGGYGSY